jgi:hypothetical protein
MRSISPYNWIELFELYWEQKWNVWNMLLGEAAVELIVKKTILFGTLRVTV